MMTTAIIGFEGLSFLSFLAVPVFLLTMFAGAGAVVSKVGMGIFNIAPSQPITLAQGITMAAGGMAVGAVIAPDVLGGPEMRKKDS